MSATEINHRVFPRIVPVAILSLSHLPKAFRRKLGTEAPCPRLVVTSRHGVLFSTFDAGKVKGRGVPVALANILRDAEWAGIAYVFFDKDAKASEKYPLFT